MEKKTAVKGMALPSTTKESQAMIDDLTDRIIGIEQQVLEARGRDTYSDPTWYSKANQALRICRAQRQKLINHLSALRKAEVKAGQDAPHRQEQERTFEREFIVQAKAMLTGNVYRSIIDAVYAARPDLPR